jgi:hypothetical protein
MTLVLSSVHGLIGMSLETNGKGGLSGTLTVNGIGYGVSGARSLSGAGPNGDYSVFQISGVQPTVNSGWAVAAGRIEGAGDFPSSVRILGATGMTGNPEASPFEDCLLPDAIDSPGLVKKAFASSSCIIVLGGSEDDPVCTACYIKGKSVTTAPIITRGDPVIINIPPEVANDGSPVSIVFTGDRHHFAEPPLKDAHHQIAQVLFDSTGVSPAKTVGLVLVYFNGSNGIKATQTQQIDFNDTHEPGGSRFIHASVVIKPG